MSFEYAFGESPWFRVAVARPDYDSRHVAISRATQLNSDTLTPDWQPVEDQEKLRIIEQAILLYLKPAEYRLRWDVAGDSKLLRLTVAADAVKLEVHAGPGWAAVPQERLVEALTGFFVHMTEFIAEEDAYFSALDRARSQPGWEDSQGYQAWLHQGGPGISPTIKQVVVK